MNSCCDPKGPIWPNDIYSAALQSAGCRCQCTGQCGRNLHSRVHDRKRGPKRDRCPVVHAERVPLHVVAADPAVPLIAACSTTAELLVLCEECRRGRDREYARSLRQACDMEPDPEELLW